MTFTGTGSDPDGSIVLYEWDFDGDGTFDYTSETTGITTHGYDSTGIYNPVFRVRDNEWLTATDYSQVVRVGSLEAIAGVDVTSGEAPLAVNLSARFVDPIDGVIDSYQWDFDGDSVFDYYSETTGDVGHTYDVAGTYTATLKITDGPYTATDGVDITVTSSAPTATASGEPVLGIAPLEVSFTGTGEDLDGKIVLYEWDFDGDGTFDWHSLTGGSASHTYRKEETYTARFKVTDNDGLTDIKEVTVEVGKARPIAVASADPEEGYPPLEVSFSATGSDDPGTGSIVLYEWDFEGDGTFDFSSADTGDTPFTYSVAGTYTATLRVTDDDGNQVSDSVTIEVIPTWMPTATAKANPITGTTPLSVEFTGTAVDPDGTIAEYQWNFGEEYVWVADTSHDQVTRLSQDGAGEIARVGGFNDPFSVSINRSDGTVWIADYYNNEVARLTADGSTEILRVGGFINPTSVSVNQTDGSVWVADHWNHQVVKLASDGTELSRASGFKNPISVTVNQVNGGVWVADYGNHQVVKLSSVGVELVRLSGFDNPISVSVNETDGSVWVADYDNDNVVKLASDGTELKRLSGFDNPTSVSVNLVEGSVWVSDNDNHQVVKLTSEGGELARFSGFNRPYSVSVNPTDGSVWVADYGNHQVVKLTSDGTEQVRLSGFSFPRAVAAIDTGPGNYHTSATNGNANHTYSSPGIYRAILTVTDNDGNSDTDSVEINAFAKPVIKGIESNLTGGEAPLELFFIGETVDLDGTIVKYEWDFDGDGTYDWVSEESANGYHVYDSGGTYDATLRVTDSDGYRTTETVQITVGQSAPAANAKAAPVRGNASLTVNFSDSSLDLDGEITRYEWDFDGDGSYDYDSSESGSTIHTYTTLGTYTATLRVTDDDGLKDTDSVTIEVSADGTPSVFLYATPREGVNPLSVHFYGHGTDPDGTLTLYEWDFEGDGTYDMSTPDAPTAFADRVEDGTGYWSVDPPWARTFAEHYSPSYSWTDSPGGDYADNEDVSLSVTTIDLSNTVEPKLIFWHRYDFRAGDFGRVEISGNDGSSWIQVGSFSNGTVNGWTRQEYDLSGYRGNATVKVRFRVTTNGSDTGDGWYIDDVWVGDAVAHTYSSHGDYTAVLRVTDNDGKQTTASETISVHGNHNISYVWVADYRNHQIVRFSDDGREYARISGFSWPRAVDVDATNGDVWVADTSNDRVVKVAGNTPNGYTTNVEKVTNDSTLNSNRGFVYSDLVPGSGKLNGGLIFNGVDDYVEVSDSESLRISNYTVEVWIKPNGVPNEAWKGIVGKPGRNFNIWLNSAGYIHHRFHTSSWWNSGAPDTPSGLITWDEWNHIAITNDGTTARTYINGVEQASGPSGGDQIIDRTSLIIGKNLDGSGGSHFDGLIDDVRIWNVARTATEIANNKDAELTGSESGLVGYWKFDTISNTPYHQLITGFDDPYDVSVDTSDGSAWVCDYNNNEVVKVASDGAELARIGGFNRPRRIDVDVANRGVWVADTGSDRVIRIPTTVSNELIMPAKKSTPDSTSNEKVGWLFGDAVSGTAKLSGGVSLDGDGDYLLIPSDAALDVEDLTVEAWIRPTSANRAIFMRGNSSGGNELLFWLDSGSTILVYLDNGSPKSFSGSVNFNDGSWHHVAAVYDSSAGQVSCYVDGALYGTPVSLSVTLDFGESHALIGADFDSFNRNIGDYFSGDIDEVRLWGVARSESEIVDSKDTELTGKERGLVGYWKLNTTTDTGIQAVTGFNDPIGISVDQKDGSVWVSDQWNHQVVKLAPDGTELYRRSGYNRPIGVSVNQSERTAWVADSAHDQVVKLAPNGSEIVRLNGFNNPHDLEVNPVDGTVWIADQTHDQVVKLAPDGRELLRLRGFNDPLSVSVDAAQRNLNQPPVVTSSADPTAGERPLEVAFRGSATDNGSIVRYEWDFDGDGVFDNDSPATGDTTHTYTVPGTYNPVLRVTDDEGLMGYDSSKTIYVGPMTVYPGQTTYEGDAPFDVNLGGLVRGIPSDRHIILYEWDFEGDGLFDWSSSVSSKVAHKYDTGGTYTAILRVTDNLGNQTYTRTTVTVEKMEPTATNNSAPTSGFVPLPVHLNGAGRDVDGSIKLYEWDYDGDGIYDWFSDSTGATYFTYTTVGTYTATLRVTDNDGFTATAAKEITVNERQDPPTASADADITKGDAPLTVNLLGTANDPDDGTITLYEWDFEGDGTYGFSSQDTGNTSHVYNEPGEFRAKLRVTDLDGLTATGTVLIAVKASGTPTAIAKATPINGPTSLTVDFDASESSDPGGDITSYEWTFGNEVVWLADNFNNRVLRVVGYQEDKELRGFNSPNRLTVNQRDGTVWLTDRFHDQVVKLKGDGSGELRRVSGFNDPEGITVNQSDGTVWVADYLNNQVVKLDKNGDELVRLDGFNRPISVSANSTDGTVWITDHNNNQLVHISSDGVEIARIDGFRGPYWVSVNQKDGTAWVTEIGNNRVVKVTPSLPFGYSVSHSLYTSDSAGINNIGHVYGDSSPVTGQLKGGVSFDGNGDYVEIPDTEEFRMDSRTMEAWVKVTANSFTGSRTIVGKVSQFKDFALVLNGDKLGILIYDGGRRYLTTDDAINADQWYHIAGVYEALSGKLMLYIDGSFIGELAVTPDTSNSDPLRIGNSSFNGEHFNGAIDDVRVWNIARSGAEIANSKDNELVGNESGLVGYWKMNSLLESPNHTSLSGFNQPHCTSVNPNDGTAWVCDFGNNEMVKISEDCSREIIRVDGFNRPLEACVNPRDGTLWVADYVNNQIVKLSAEGSVIEKIDGLNHPTSVALYNDRSNIFNSTSKGTTAHTYNRIGSYVATLRVTDDEGISDTDTVTITAGNFPESLPGAYPTTGPAPLTVRVSANGRSPESTIEYFHWDFDGDGSTDWTTRISENHEYTFFYPGIYRVTQEVVDNNGLRDSKAVTITVTQPDSLPTADASVDHGEGVSPLFVNLTGLGKDKDGFIAKYEWDFEGDGVFDFTSETTGKATHTYDLNGIYKPLLRVTDNDGNVGVDSVRVEVKPPGAPTAHANFQTNSGVASLNVNFTGSGLDDGNIVLYEWDFDGDGTYDRSATSPGEVSYSYTTPGSYTAILRVTDDAGLTDTFEVNVSVSLGLTATLSEDMLDPTNGEAVKINSTLTADAIISHKDKGQSRENSPYSCR
ncbi:MAG: PKD domain-containing protein [Planctomycetes bacterium]|nr:PKD domain-containing protein [Planctomycetota bacterium]